MKLHEFVDKWKTDEKKQVEFQLPTPGGSNVVKINQSVHTAYLGDFINEYIKHHRVPFWKKGGGWAIVDKRFRYELNQISLIWYE